MCTCKLSYCDTRNYSEATTTYDTSPIAYTSLKPEFRHLFASSGTRNYKRSCRVTVEP